MKVLVTAHGPKSTDTNAAAKGEIAYIVTDSLFCGLDSRRATSCARVVEMDISPDGLVKKHFDSTCKALGGMIADIPISMDSIRDTVMELVRIANVFDEGDVVRIKKGRITGGYTALP